VRKFAPERNAIRDQPPASLIGIQIRRRRSPFRTPRCCGTSFTGSWIPRRIPVACATSPTGDSSRRRTGAGSWPSFRSAGACHLRGSFWQRFPEYRHEPVPAVFVEESPGVLRTLISAEELRGVADLEALETLLASRVDMLSTIRVTRSWNRFIPILQAERGRRLQADANLRPRPTASMLVRSRVDAAPGAATLPDRRARTR
jgi:hypothetical protein